MGYRLAVLLLAALLSGCSARTVPRDKSIDAIEALNDDVDEEPSREERECLRFLNQHIPTPDRMSLRYEFLYNQVHLALKARADNAWASAVPWDIFQNNVLPYANLDEPREDWRSDFYTKFAPLVAGTSSTLEAAVALNYQIWTLGDWNITFRSEQTPDIMSPSQVIAHGYASCTGLAIFFVDACRAVGIPARVAGIASWPETDGNHNWVEVWHDGVWSFTDPIGFPNRPWNQTWFFPDPVRHAVPHSYSHGVYAASFKHTGRLFPLAWHDEYESIVPAYEVTQYYIDAAAGPEDAPGEDSGEGGKGGEDGGDVPWDVAQRVSAVGFEAAVQ